MLSTRESELELLKLVSWSLSAFFLIKTNTKEISRQICKVLTWFAKYYLEVLWSFRRWMPPYGLNLSTQSPSRDTMCKAYGWHFCYLLVIILFAYIVLLKYLFLFVMNYVQLEFSRMRYVGGLCRSRLPYLSPLNISLYLNYVRPEVSRMRYVGGLCRPRSAFL